MYDSLFAPKEDYVLQFEDSDPQARTKPVTHNDILAAAAVLRRDPALTLDQASEQLAARSGIACSAQEFRFTLLVSTQALLMLDSTGQADRWQPDERFVDFVSRRIPETAGPCSAALKAATENQRSMKAWKLRARFRLSFKGTDNLARHLLLDPLHPDGPTLYIFHYTAFLKAHMDRLGEAEFSSKRFRYACQSENVGRLPFPFSLLRPPSF